jgi:methylated-DNA-[protein]-cysteine S-methyltransferase
MEVVQLDTPVGTFRAYVDDGRVRESRFVEGGGAPRAEDRKVADALTAYFAGEVEVIDSLSVDAVGTKFQQRVWHALRKIPVGETASYGEIADAIGCPGAARAVGSANASNPVGIIVPCHRVVRGDGSLGGYGFGVERKRWLLEHERGGPLTLV